LTFTDGMPTTVLEASDREPGRVLIAGGGVAALEALLALRALAPRALSVEMLAPTLDFRPQPLSVAEPFGMAEPTSISLDTLVPAAGGRFRQGALAELDPARRLVTTDRGEALEFDALLVAIGARSRPALPGALTFCGLRDVESFRLLLDEIETGAVRSVVFALPGAARWSLPLYELALMTAARAAMQRAEVRIELVTHERAPLQVFGPRVSEHVARLLRGARIAFRPRTRALVAQPGRLFVAGGAIAADRVVALGGLSVASIAGLPQHRNGFIPVDEYMRVEGTRHVYAAGDATWFPLKQGGIAAQQADVAAASIAADLGIDVPLEPYEPVLRGILLTGDAPQYIRDDEIADAPLWSPASKIAGTLLGPYLAGVDRTLTPALVDRPEPAQDHGAAVQLALQAADAAAGWGEPQDALRWLRVAEGLNVALPMRYADRRRSWSELAAAGKH
jgi:sulfide:quinone oxidoreductase